LVISLERDAKAEPPVQAAGGSAFNLIGAEDGIRTRDLLLGKEMLYH
jgi:hypothetical protein